MQHNTKININEFNKIPRKILYNTNILIDFDNGFDSI